MKMTRLYVVGAAPEEAPQLPPAKQGEPTHVITQGRRAKKGEPGFRSRVTDAEREHTPPALAAWLVELAAKCKTHNAELSRAHETTEPERDASRCASAPTQG